MEIKVVENEEENNAEEIKAQNPLDFEEPENVDWEKELSDPEEDGEDDAEVEIDEDDIAVIIEAGSISNDDAAVFEEAKSIGIDSESLAEFQSDPQALKKALNLLKTQGNFSKSADEQNADIPAGDTYKATINRDQYDSDIVEQFESLEKVSQGLYARLQKLELQLQSTSQDDLFQKVDDKFTDLLGQGPTTLLNNGTQVSNRNQVIEQMDLLKAGYQNLGKDVPSPQKLFSQAVKTTFTDQIEELTEKKINSKMAKRQNQKTARPTKRSGRKLDPRMEAEKSVAKLMRERGLLGTISEKFE